MSFPSTPHLPPVPDTPPQPRAPTPDDTKPGRHTGRSLFVLLLVPPALTITIIVVMRNMGAYGKSKLIGTIILCCLGLLVVIGAVATLLASVQDLRAAKRSGDRRAVRKQLDNLASMTCGVLVIAAPVFYFLTPAVIDLVQGPQPRAVASCSYAQDTVTRSQWFTGGTSYNNQFVMRFDDGTQHTFTIATSEQDISQLSGIIHPLYEGCVLHPDQTPLTIDMYVHSKTLVDARLD
ncbi:MAG: hypothetical protein KH266_08825 [Actinomyces sp.]|nr:hypothetical protein [Actinomyces sp.]